MSVTWNYDVEAAKRQGRILVCVDNEEKWVGWSQWIHQSARWEMIGTKETILCWAKPEHPHQ